MDNPFNTLYVTENLNPDEFILTFSPLLISDTLPLFQEGNSVLTGTQGCGKSMLLALLKPEVRIAYHSARLEFPISNVPFFLGAGINLTRSGAIYFGERMIEPGHSDSEQRHVGYFGDFLNYWIALDIIDSVIKFQESEVGARVGVDFSEENQRLFAHEISRKGCWFGYLDGLETVQAVREKIIHRITRYRGFFNFQTESLEPEIRATKTTPGEPISRVADAFRDTGIVPERCPFFIRIDQYEELWNLEASRGSSRFYRRYREVIHRMIGLRDPRISYKIGTRSYGWHEAPELASSAGAIEEMRNYKKIDIDLILRRSENGPSTFNRFAEDVFRRRMSGQFAEIPRKNVLARVFGSKISPQDKAKKYAKTNGFLRIPDGAPKQVIETLFSLAKSDPLSAKLGEAWVRQQLERNGTDFPKADYLPWESKKWWFKERVSMALLHIAAMQRQRLIWSGSVEILALSGGNILVFLNICQYIWSSWLRGEARDPSDERLPEISNVYIQDSGILMVSQFWYKKIASTPRGNSLQRFVEVLCKELRNRLLNDKRMSYPGENGFSLSNIELEEDAALDEFLKQAVGFGVLFDRPHTPKIKSLGMRRKYYPNPILCPYFQLPAAHTKEPWYVKPADIRRLMARAHVEID